jgi:hypothetical protein
MAHELIERVSCDRCTEFNEEPVPPIHEGGIEPTKSAGRPADWGFMVFDHNARETEDAGFMLCSACTGALATWILNEAPATERCGACSRDFMYLQRHIDRMHPLLEVTTIPPSIDAKRPPASAIPDPVGKELN